MRREQRLKTIAGAIERLIPGAIPAYLAVKVTDTLPGAMGQDSEPHTHAWNGSPVGLAERILTAQEQEEARRPDTGGGQLSPLAQAEGAKRARDLVGEVGALMDGYAQLTTASWYPARPGDLVHVHYEAGGLSDAFGETYLISAGAHGFLSMRLLAHTCPGEEDGVPVVGCFAVDDDPDPIVELWMEAGPHRLTVVRDGRPVHIGEAR